MVGCFDAIDGSADEIDETSGTFELVTPVAEGTGVPGDVSPGSGDAGRGSREDDD